MVANKSLAEYNLSQEPVLKAKRQQLTSKHSEAVSMISSVKSAKEELEQKSGKIQPDSLYYLLEVEASNAETESDEIANDYLDKKIESTDEFLEKFVVTKTSIFWPLKSLIFDIILQALRKTMYLRRVKLDKMRELMNNPTKTPARKAPEPPAAANYTPPFGSHGQPSAAPINSWDSPGASNPPPNLPYPIRPNVGLMPQVPGNYGHR